MQVQRKTIAKAIVVIFVFNLIVMGVGAWVAYQEAPPIPEQVTGPDGDVVVTDEQIREGKRVFQQNGLMNHGSILGSGAYYGEDFTADALDLKVQHMRDYFARERYGNEYDKLSSARQAAIADAVKQELDSSYDGGAVQYSAAELYAHKQVRQEYVARYHEGSYPRGVPEGMIESPEDAREFADFAMWTAWFSRTDRPETTRTRTTGRTSPARVTTPLP